MGLPDMVFLERTPRAAEDRLESMAEARARKVKLGEERSNELRG